MSKHQSVSLTVRLELPVRPLEFQTPLIVTLIVTSIKSVSIGRAQKPNLTLMQRRPNTSGSQPLSFYHGFMTLRVRLSHPLNPGIQQITPTYQY
ncbi:MAG: hypothetical protein MI976_18605 [Pseudomonadales bacterium]|nr:hypothetical protein [Pseudomonadales bacterium]